MNVQKIINQITMCKSLIIIFISFLTAGVFGQHSSDVGISKSEIIPVDPEVKIDSLRNGLTYYIRENQEPEERAQLYLVVKAGSLQEKDNQLGLAHFTEHMAFNGTRNFPKNELIGYLEEAGVRFGADLNAYTGFNETVYQLPLPTDKPELFESGFKILSDWAGHISFNNSEIDKERGVIVSEKRQRGNNVSERMSEQLLPVIFADSRYAQRLPIGETDIIENFEYQTLKDYYDKWYTPELQAVIAVGDFDAEKVEKYIKKYFSGLPSSEDPVEKKTFSIPSNEEPLVKIVTDPEFPHTVASVTFKHPETTIKTRDDLRRAVIRSAINSMLSARINELLKSGTAPFLNAGASYGSFQGGMANKDAFTVQVVAKKPEQLRKAIDGIMKEVLRMTKFGFTQSELERIKENFMTAIEKSYKEKDNTPSINYVNQYLEHFKSGEAIISADYSHKFYKEELEDISIEEVNKIASELVTPNNQIIIVRAPEKNLDVLPGENELIEWVNDPDRKITAYVDDVLDKSLMENIPDAGEVKSVKTHEDSGVTEAVLSNGVRVILKPTEFKTDEILYRAFSPGGYSLSEEAEVFSSKMADDIVASSGLGDFSSVQISKMLAGKSLAVVPNIGLYSEGIRGSASPEDLETALKVIHLYFTRPRKDSVAFNRLIENYKVSIKAKGTNPMAVFQDTINVVMKGRGAWAQDPTIEEVNEISLEQAFEFYKERFSDAGDFTFVFVGNFEVDSILPLLNTYLGSLPSVAGKENYNDVGIKPLKGNISKTVYDGLADKAVVVLAYHDDYEYTRKNNLQLQALESALETRMLERLREKEGGVYSPSVSLSLVKIPNPHYSIAVSFSTSSELSDKLMEAAIDEIEKLKNEGPTLEELNKFIAQEKRQRQVNLETNGFWLNYLKSVYTDERNLPDYKTYFENLNNLELQEIKEAAREFLTTGNNIKLILLPENSEVE